MAIQRVLDHIQEEHQVQLYHMAHLFWNLFKQSANKLFLHFNSQLSGDNVLALKLGIEMLGS